jgi:hypothetical protein
VNSIAGSNINFHVIKLKFSGMTGYFYEGFGLCTAVSEVKTQKQKYDCLVESSASTDGVSFQTKFWLFIFFQKVSNHDVYRKKSVRYRAVLCLGFSFSNRYKKESALLGVFFFGDYSFVRFLWEF